MTTVVVGDECWELGEQIGEGGAGRVYLATCGTYEPHVIKLVPQVKGASRELLIADDLRGVPNVVPVIGQGCTDTDWVLLMPKAEQSLRDHLVAMRGPVPEREALVILLDIALALARLAQARTVDRKIGVVHRDLKPENVLFLNGSWCISDFGTARYATDATAADTSRYFMTHDYAAPEQWRGETATAATDVYAFGIIAFELLSGRRPFAGPDFRRQHLEVDAPPLRGISPRLANIITQCLYKLAGTRPAPDRLLGILEREQGHARSGAVAESRGISALQSASLADSVRAGEESRTVQAERDQQSRREQLLDLAREQHNRISDSLYGIILEHAPSCRAYSTGKNGWQLHLNQGIVAFSSMGNFAARKFRSFEVIAHAFVAAGSAPQRLGQHEGFAHALWFCDAWEAGRFAWHEVTFRPGASQSVVHQKEYLFHEAADPRKQMSGYLEPMAPFPSEVAYFDLREPGGGGGKEQRLEQSFVPLMQPSPLWLDDLDGFLDRWASFFAAATLGNYTHPLLPEVTRRAPENTVLIVGNYEHGEYQPWDAHGYSNETIDLTHYVDLSTPYKTARRRGERPRN